MLKYINLKPKFTKNTSYHKMRTAHCLKSLFSY